MICISINEESRRFAIVDMHNAAKQCDLLEIRLDRFGKSPEIGELLSVKPKPVIMSCRRASDGGHWSGSEEERLSILRQCIVSKADYVEIELDVADQIRPFPPARRVIAYHNLRETPANIGEIYAEALTKKPDVVKLVTLARTPEEAWPLVKIMGKAQVPTVVVGYGKPGLMLSVLGKKIGAPWTYAALERGMEAYPGQPTVADLETIYHYRAIDKGTKLISVTGFGPREIYTVAGLNAALAHLGLPARCLPMGVGSSRLFRKVLDAVKSVAVVVDEAHQATLLEIAEEKHGAARETETIDLLLHKQDMWHGYHTGFQAAIEALAGTIEGHAGSEQALKGRMAVIVGINALARLMAAEIQKRGAGVILASHQRKAAQQLAQTLGCRFVQFEALYSTSHDVLLICDEEKDQSAGSGVHPGYLRAGMTVMDLTVTGEKSVFAEDARRRGCHTVDPRQLLVKQLELQTRMITSKTVPDEVLQNALQPLWDE